MNEINSHLTPLFMITALLFMVLLILTVYLWRRKIVLESELIIVQSELKLQKSLKKSSDEMVAKTQDQIKTMLDASSAKALSRNSTEFLKLAETTFKRFTDNAGTQLQQKHQAIDQLIDPLKQTLSQVDLKLQDIEKKRLSAYDILRHQVQEMVQSQKDLRTETANLAKALRTPHIRGRWGEMQLRRVVEMSGMSSHCDFLEQETLEDDFNTRLRPDLIVNLPGKKQIIVDSKAPLIGFLDALDASTDAERKVHLQAHARHIKKHITQLSSKSYWQSVKEATSPEFVILFLPGETFFTAALEQDPTLIEQGVENKVILATPATLIAMLHAIAYGWRQEALSENAREISILGRDMSKRLGDFTQHLSKLGRALGSSVSHFNRAVGTLDRRIYPVARKFHELQRGAKDEVLSGSIEQPTQIEQAVREVDYTEEREKSLA